MGRENRRGDRKSRERVKNRRVPELGYYIIVTNAEETEQNYLYGLRDAIPPSLRNKLVIKVFRSSTKDLIDRCKELMNQDPQYRMPWIIFDRDREPDFDKIIEQAKKEGFSVGWSNPCIEIWFYAYFGKMPTVMESVRCCESFAKKFKQNTGLEYDKADTKILKRLRQYGDEDKAIEIARKHMCQWEKDGVTRPSHMCPGSTLFELVEEINNKSVYE